MDLDGSGCGEYILFFSFCGGGGKFNRSPSLKAGADVTYSFSFYYWWIRIR